MVSPVLKPVAANLDSVFRVEFGLRWVSAVTRRLFSSCGVRWRHVTMPALLLLWSKAPGYGLSSCGAQA